MDPNDASVFVQRYSFPLVRFYTKMVLFLLLDLVSSSVLWLDDPNGDHFKKSVTEFHIRTSVFDLVVLSIVKVAILAILYNVLETLTFRIATSTNTASHRKSWMFVSLLLWILNFGNLIYVTFKGVLVLQDYRSNKSVLTDTYYALCISSFVFALLEIFVFIWYLSFLKKQKSVYQRLTEEGSSHDPEAKPEKKEAKKSISITRLMKLAKPEALLIFLGTLGLAASSGSQMIAPMYFGNVIEAATIRGMAALNRDVIVLFLIYLLGAVGSFFRSWLYTLAGQRLVARLRKMIFDQIISQEVAFFDVNRTGELMNRLSSDSQVIQNALSVNISMLIRYSVQITGSIIIMFIVSPKLTGVLLAVVPVVAIGAQKYGAYVRDQQKIFQDELAKSASSAEETISSIRTVRSFAQEEKSSRAYGGDIDKSYQAGAKLSLASGFFNFFIGVATQGAIALVLWYGGKLVHQGHMNVGQLTSFILYALNIAMAFAFLSSLYGDFMKAVGSSIRIFELLDRMPEIKPGTLELPSAKVSVQFDDVYFSYPTRPDTQVLQGITFGINPGETVALVGPSGGGKSTVISLIERLYDPLEGKITFGEKELRELNPNWFRKKISIVSQEPTLFATTIAENIAYGKEATQEEIEEAAKQANAHDFITTFEDGYETSVGERGIKLSGGQKQRVAIARALLMDPDILLLDEATSALDAESEHLVQEAIDRAMVGRTVLVIAHRLSTVRDANKVIVIQQGKIAEEGTHEELLELDGVYKKLVLRQLEAGEQPPSQALTDTDSQTQASGAPSYSRFLSTPY